MRKKNREEAKVMRRMYGVFWQPGSLSAGQDRARILAPIVLSGVGGYSYLKRERAFEHEQLELEPGRARALARTAKMQRKWKQAT